jgi:hypothetical protein
MVAVWGLIGLLGVSSACAWPAGVDHSIFLDESPSAGERPTIHLDGAESGQRGGGVDDSRASKIIGVSLLGSGIFLCSWGIASWEVKEYQCCPAHNTGNIVKIVTGVVLINAGLIYLLEAGG